MRTFHTGGVDETSRMVAACHRAFELASPGPGDFAEAAGKLSVSNEDKTRVSPSPTTRVTKGLSGRVARPSSGTVDGKMIELGQQLTRAL
jgi:hypothetical protein